MNTEQSIALYNEGKDAWNEWANGMLAEKEQLITVGKWEDKSKCNFVEHTFIEQVNFAGFVFPGNASFDRTTFLGSSQFQGSSFHKNAVFHKTKFAGVTLFHRVIFSGRTLFHQASFRDNSVFESARFNKMVLFIGAEFLAGANFASAVFDGPANFANAKFIADPNNPNAIARVADFKAINSESYFNLDGAKFELAPDFTQAHFLEAPSLDGIIIGPQARENPTQPLRQSPSPLRGGIKGGGEETILRQAQDEGKQQAQDEGKQQAQDEGKQQAQDEGKKQIPSRWRHLRRLATQGQDHENEGYFFAEELKSRRKVFDFPRGKNWQRWWVGWLYQGFSDFGRSMWRPLWIWFSVTLAYASTLLIAHDFIAKNRTPFELGLNGCLLGDSTPWSTALKVAFDNAIFLPQFGVSNGQVQENLCLFGYDIGLKMPNLPPVALVPTWIVGLGAFHAVFSAAMVFLILLAIRNQFRIR